MLKKVTERAKDIGSLLLAPAAVLILILIQSIWDSPETL